MRARLCVVAVVLLLFSLSGPGGAYWRSGQRWASGARIVMHLQMGSSGGSLLDGSSTWNTVAERTLSTWNTYLNGVSFSVIRDSTAGTGFGNGTNNVIWSRDMFGDSWGDAIAVARYSYWTSDNTIAEADVLFDSNRSWNSYRGNLRSASGGGTLFELQRVALHEFGHVVGLGHPDQHGQSVRAIMNSTISDIDSLQTDDTNGATAIYGAVTPTPANRAPTVTASCSPCTVQTGQTSDLGATATDPDGDTLSYQWTAPQGTFRTGTSASTVWTAPTATGSVTATITVQDGRGGRATATVALQVVLRDRLDAGRALTVGQSIVSSNSRYRLVYQGDGNLVLYDDVDRVVPWASNTGGTSPSQALMQSDGNFVIYTAPSGVAWATGTSNSSGAYLQLQNDSNLVIYHNGQPIWDRHR